MKNSLIGANVQSLVVSQKWPVVIFSNYTTKVDTTITNYYSKFPNISAEKTEAVDQCPVWIVFAVR